MDSEARNRRIAEVAESLRGGGPGETISVRELVGWFDASRRGVNVNWTVRRALEQFGLVTVPDFEGSHIDGSVAFALVPPAPIALNAPVGDVHGEPGAAAVAVEQAPIEFVGGAGVEPAYRVSRLLNPRLQLISIGPDATLEVAATVMLRHDYSQLPVMTNDRNVRGIVSWDTIGPAMALG